MGTLEITPPQTDAGAVGSRTVGEHGEPVAILELVLAPGAIAAGRRGAAQAARTQGAGDAVADLVELLASELLTNAFRHGPARGSVTVHVVQHDDVLRVTVHDRGDARPRMRSARPTDEGGRGLALVDMLSAAWGVDRDPAGGKSVWFEVVLGDTPVAV